MNVRLIVMLLIVSFHAPGAVAQRVDLPLDGFQPVADTQLQISPPWLVMMTTAMSAGGAYRCVDLRGPARFGGIGFIPSRLPNGQPNRGRGGIALVPYTETGCSGDELERLTASPMFDDSTPRDVEFPMIYTGAVPATAKSALFLVAATTTSAQSFQLCFRGGWVEQTGAPDLVPDVTIHVGNLVTTDPGTPNQRYMLSPEGPPMGQGDLLPRGRFLLMHVDVKNAGTASANPWTVTVRAPQGWQFSTLPSNCKDFDAAGVHKATSPLAPGETRRLCAALMPNAGAAAVRVSAETSVTNDSNPGNDVSSSDFFEVEAPRGAAPLPPDVLNHLNGRR